MTARHTIVEVRRNLARLLDREEPPRPAAQRVAEPGLRFVTFGTRQGGAARQLGLEVVPA